MPLACAPLLANILLAPTPVSSSCPRPSARGSWCRLSLHPCCNRFAVAGVPLTNHPTNANLLLIAVLVPREGAWGSAGQCPVPLCARLRRTCHPLVLRARGSLPLPLTSQSQEPSPPFFRHWRHSASVPTLQKKKMALRHPLSKNKTPILQLLLYPSFFPIPAVPWNPE